MSHMVAVSQRIRALRDADIRGRIQATGDLVTLGESAAEALIASLNDAHPEVRWRAIVALGWIGDTRAVEALLAALADSAWEVRQNAAWALGQIGDIRAAGPLFTAIHDQDEQVCVLAAYALARMGDHERLQSAVHSTDEHARRAASAGLCLLANTRSSRVEDADRSPTRPLDIRLVENS